MEFYIFLEVCFSFIWKENGIWIKWNYREFLVSICFVVYFCIEWLILFRVYVKSICNFILKWICDFFNIEINIEKCFRVFVLD